MRINMFLEASVCLVESVFINTNVTISEKKALFVSLNDGAFKVVSK